MRMHIRMRTLVLLRIPSSEPSISILSMQRRHFSRVKLNEHSPISLEFLERNGKAEVIEDEKLEFEVVEFVEGEAADLRRSRMSVSEAERPRRWRGV